MDVPAEDSAEGASSDDKKSRTPARKQFRVGDRLPRRPPESSVAEGSLDSGSLSGAAPQLDILGPSPQIDSQRADLSWDIRLDPPKSLNSSSDAKDSESEFHMGIGGPGVNAPDPAQAWPFPEGNRRFLAIATARNDDAWDTEREDSLSVEEDARAFARLALLQTFKPPLAVGIFGSWGAGKSFFMPALWACYP